MIELGKSAYPLDFRQRWATYLTMILALLALGYSVIERNNQLFAVTSYTDVQVGLTFLYPTNWLRDVSEGEYIFRARDMQRTGFKTTIQVSLLAVSSDLQERNIADRLSFSRAQILTGYTVLGTDDLTLPDDTSARSILYTFVSQEASPFLEGIPTVVTGIDILTINRGQAIVLTFRAEADAFEQEYARFEQFLETLEF